tara:strand:+ start:133 stop:441 length:309 start_codon:yes stop_codon:yes gene_type:complete
MTPDEQSQYWQEMVEECSASDLSAKEFCRQWELNYTEFLRWRKKFQSPGIEASASEQVSFEEINPNPLINLSSGRLQIQIEKDIDRLSLSLVIGALCDAANQ